MLGEINLVHGSGSLLLHLYEEDLKSRFGFRLWMASL